MQDQTKKLQDAFLKVIIKECSIFFFNLHKFCLDYEKKLGKEKPVVEKKQVQKKVKKQKKIKKPNKKFKDNIKKKNIKNNLDGRKLSKMASQKWKKMTQIEKSAYQITKNNSEKNDKQKKKNKQIKCIQEKNQKKIKFQFKVNKVLIKKFLIGNIKMVRKETQTKKTITKKVFNKNDTIEKKNKIQKVTKKHQDIRQVYQKILIHIKKRKQNPDRLNLAIKEALTLLKTKQNAQYNSAIGSKLLQIILKHGQKDQKEVILLLLAKEDIFAICKSNYGSFIIEKVFRYANKGKSFKLFKKFFKDNFEILLKNFEYLRSVNAYINSMDKKLQIELIMNNKQLFQRDEFIMNEFIESAKEKITLLHMSLTYYFIFFNYDKIHVEKKQLLTTLMINNLEKALQQNNEVMICLVVLSKLFVNMNMKFKKEILKSIFAENFTKYLEYNSNFIYLLLSLLSRLKDQKVINITVLKNIRLNFNQYFEKVQLAKILLIILQNNITRNIHREKTLTKNILQEQIIQLENLEQNEQFITNLKFFQKQILEENLLQPYFKIDIIKKNLEVNSIFSLLYVAIFHIITLDDEYSLFVLQLFRELHQLIEYDLDFNKDSSEHFINSNNGSRFIKGIIQSIPQCSQLNIDMVEEFVKQICALVEKKPESFIHCKSVFVLIAILENSKHSQQLKKILEDSGQMEVNNKQKGFMILKELMSKQII